LSLEALTTALERIGYQMGFVPLRTFRINSSISSLERIGYQMGFVPIVAAKRTG
jgi:hypothetical protein